MTSTTHHQIPHQVTSGNVLDTTDMDASAPLLDHGAPISDPGQALRDPNAAALNKLNTFLMTKFPRQMNRTNRQQPESPVDVAIRLLEGLGTAGTGIQRCAEQYCNLPADHDGDHGYVNYTPR